jgi:periplasmic protein TonB
MTEMQSERWTDIVFENRNKAYGAYFVRAGYERSLGAAILISSFFLLLVLFLPAIIRLFSPPEKVIATPYRTTIVDLGAPPAIDTERPPPLKISLPPANKKVFKFTPPVLTQEQVAEELPENESLKKKQTGSVSEDGSDNQFTGADDGIEGEGEDAIYSIVDKAAEFPGGPVVMGRFLAKSMRYPQEARRAGLEGVVHVSFIVGKNGLITDIEIVKGLSPECDAEALAVVRMMPRWRPAHQNGVPVRSRLVLPLRFKLGMKQ